jgi:hypothetical protein
MKLSYVHIESVRQFVCSKICDLTAVEVAKNINGLVWAQMREKSSAISRNINFLIWEKIASQILEKRNK